MVGKFGELATFGEMKFGELLYGVPPMCSGVA